MHKWEEVYKREGFCETRRMEVPGGWLYLHVEKIITPNGQINNFTQISTSMCFTPDNKK